MDRECLSNPDSKNTLSDTVWAGISLVFLLGALAITGAFFIAVFKTIPEESFPFAGVFVGLYLFYKLTRLISRRRN